MAKGTFGEHLKREREMRGVSLDEIAAATRIAPRFLRAIEDEEWDELPGGVFNRGFVRAVAHYLGLDEESIVAEYGMVAGVRQSVPVWTGSPPAVAPNQPWLAWILAAVIAIALIAGGIVGIRRISAWRAARRAGQMEVPMEVPGEFPGPSDGPAALPPAIPVAANSAPQADFSDPSRASISAAAGSSSVAGTASTAANVAAAAAAAPAGTLQLKIATEKKTRLTVATDAQRVFEGNIRPGEVRIFSAKDQFQVSTKNAGALQLELNGKTLGPMGPAGRSAKITLTRQSLKEASGGGN